MTDSMKALEFSFGGKATSHVIMNQQLPRSIILVLCFMGYSVSEGTEHLNHAAIGGKSHVDTSMPLNIAVVRGGPTVVQLNCSVPINAVGYWSYTSPSFLVQNEEQIYSGQRGVVNQFKDMFSIDESVKGHLHLVIKESSKRTAGRYTCTQKHFENSTDHSSQVIVLDAKPTCSQIYKPGFVNATCSIGFSGFWSPMLEWHNTHGKLHARDHSTTEDSRVSSSVVLPVHITDLPESYILTCTPKFAFFNKPPGTTAENIPEFPHNCITTESPDIEKALLANDSVSTNACDWLRPSPHVCSCLVTLIFIGMFHK